ncbi:Solvent efflux pump outer membrane protein SrpC [Polaromonas vacuolata]|uniref:Solvent efflux pump outer membrane protein SrpC n=1 Tax=Polaromonas vacuolata TaxID=37448 RepID=A0A6H2HE00_9BURK|nr:efflux transporter outer membrane subunit [Polaromonas vacuolata]QJC58119.1 Solvent efflux pump outer membrane protein SrpC [Polaromonas vacuolata]
MTAYVHTGRGITLALAMALALAGCAVNRPPASPSILSSTPPEWYAAKVKPDASATADAVNKTPASSDLPNDIRLSQLTNWWQLQNDALLLDLIQAAQNASPSLLTALANITQARANTSIAQAALLPTLDASVSTSRSLAGPINRAAAAPASLQQLGLQTSWEIDVFGRASANRDAASERLLGAGARWHAARVSVAAEAASQYYQLRSCESQLRIAQADTRSREQTSALAGLAAKAGFESPANAALARAGAAESRARSTLQRGQCEQGIKALVALTAMPEPELREKLAQAPLPPPQQALLAPDSLPAQVISQRPDVFNAAREVAASSFEVANARAERYPQLSLSGSISRNKTFTRNQGLDFSTWSVGPLSLNVPLFDGGANQAHIASARARYEDAASLYRGTVRQAVQEVEQALVMLQSSADRNDDAALAALGFETFFDATEARQRAGLASLVDLEDARRSLLNAQAAVASLALERRKAWIALYRALGGGWSSASAMPAAMTFQDLVSP